MSLPDHPSQGAHSCRKSLLTFLLDTSMSPLPSVRLPELRLAEDSKTPRGKVTSRFLHQSPTHIQIMLVNTLYIHTTPHIRMQLVPMHGRYKSPTLLYSKYSTLHFTSIFPDFFLSATLFVDGISSQVPITSTATGREWTKKYKRHKHTHHLI